MDTTLLQGLLLLFNTLAAVLGIAAWLAAKKCRFDALKAAERAEKSAYAYSDLRADYELDMANLNDKVLPLLERLNNRAAVRATREKKAAESETSNTSDVLVPV